MHEMAIMGDVVDVVLDYAKQSGANEVTSVHLVVGTLRDVVDDLMERCFQFLARGTIAGNATLKMTKVPLRLLCKDCDTVFPADMHLPDTLVCPRCGSHNLDVNTGREFMIENIEIK